VLLSRVASVLPQNFFEAVLFAFLWGCPVGLQSYFHQAVTEFHLRDPRFGLALIAAMALVIRRFRQEVRVNSLFFTSVFFLGSFILWEMTDPAFRYLSYVEMLTGP